LNTNHNNLGYDTFQITIFLYYVKEESVVKKYERRKGAPTLENYNESWRLFTGLALHLGSGFIIF
jgi:uncharacterized phage-like protein YoqJ|tara:strand:- start:224 stop:418 length:195 start_codon:yes stop_codon:yes gene_type:complete